MANKKRFQTHFRKFHHAKVTGHPQYVYGEEGKYYKILGITKSSVTNGVKNIELSCNPEPGNKEKAYIRPKPDKIDKGVKNKRLNGWKFSEQDKKIVQSVIEKKSNKKPRKK